MPRVTRLSRISGVQPMRPSTFSYGSTWRGVGAIEEEIDIGVWARTNLGPASQWRDAADRARRSVRLPRFVGQLGEKRQRIQRRQCVGVDAGELFNDGMRRGRKKAELVRRRLLSGDWDCAP